MPLEVQGGLRFYQTTRSVNLGLQSLEDSCGYHCSDSPHPLPSRQGNPAPDSRGRQGWWCACSPFFLTEMKSTLAEALLLYSLWSWAWLLLRSLKNISCMLGWADHLRPKSLPRSSLFVITGSCLHLSFDILVSNYLLTSLKLLSVFCFSVILNLASELFSVGKSK